MTTQTAPSAARFATELLDVAALADYLLLDDHASVYSLTRKRGKANGQLPLPSIRIGKELRFRKSSVDAWLEAKERRDAGAR